ncbi:hypothetical protein Lal_00019258 [Lupinus albus]|uniref:Uncharacterized protein n=1 Tax=Lupinus albus TaxID=3870 RepID=A0A6A5PMP5_LUPAL|nr:hypothetical protein Lalb_Chr01g0008621 [Lupinus albus]KAF1899136.1 hypothetical protein Lal_00019258 [Lupinus albus]
MAVSDSVVSNLTLIYVAVIASIKVFGLICGRSFTSTFVLILSTTLVALILVLTLMWDVSRKATYAFAGDHLLHPHPLHRRHRETCKGGICWHGVAVRSPASQLRFRLPQHLPYAL